MKAPQKFVDAYTVQPKLFIGNWNGFSTPFGAVIKEDTAKVRAHEACHVEQWWRYGVIGFPFVYGYQSLKDGYWNCELETEARIAGLSAEMYCNG